MHVNLEAIEACSRTLEHVIRVTHPALVVAPSPPALRIPSFIEVMRKTVRGFHGILVRNRY